MSLFLHRRRPSRRARRHFLSLLPLLCLALLTAGLSTARAAAAEQGAAREEKASWEITYLGRSGQALPEEDEAGEAEEVPSTQEDGWELLLVNRDNSLPQDFVPPELTDVGGGQLVDSRIADSLRQMLSDARKAGLHPIVCSAYRTQAKQSQLYQRKVRYYQSLGYSRTKAEEKAAFWVARPDTSEHQAGLAVDIISAEYQILNQMQESTAVQQWLMAHCAEYGFILRYPTDKSDITQVGYEPWHYRYVGELAREITDSGLCLEEYLTGR